MTPLQEWLLLYLEPSGSSGFTDAAWRDGHLYCEALNKIFPEWFSKIRLRSNSLTSWVFMKGNLGRVLRTLTGYYRHQLGLLLHTTRMPDLTQLARLGQEEEMEALIRLILGVALTCELRANHINIILSLNTQITANQDNKIPREIVMTDFGCQHSGVLETSFDDDEELSPTRVLLGEGGRRQHKGNCRSQQDFQCQVNTEIQSSRVIDVDDFPERRDSATDPVFEDKTNIKQLEGQIRSLLAATRGEKNLREKLEATEALLDRATREVEKLNSALALSSTETEQLRVYYEQLRRKDLSEIETLLHELDAVKDQNLDLKEEKKEIEERLWNLEMMMKKQNFSRNIILISNSPETISTTSSGFISNTSQSEQGEVSAQLELELETERLSDLLGVMEMREEQLVGELRSQQEARRQAERRLTSKLAGEELGRKMKKVLLLTAAFGAVHTALQHDILAGACTVL